MRWIRISLCGLAAVAAAASAPAAAQSNCVWGCHCEGTGCACNSRGSGGSCENTGTDCTVTGCVPVKTSMLAPDGSPVQLASLETTPAAAGGPPHVRWEYVSRGRSAARDCSGVVVARHFDPHLAAAVRRRQQTISI